ncbi:MAG TPA: hypothetical protein VMA30_16065 [Xanthobacteraceae bacterium]|nr:hypothetical protein [Xanthobacteraceae bacterium]
MTLRSAPGNARQVVALDYEVAQEQASALGRLGRALEAALEALAAFDREPEGKGLYEPARNQGHHPDHNPDLAAPQLAAQNRAARAKLVAEAGHALWCFIVQRESCGLRDPRPVICDYRVPAEVQNRMGILIPPATAPRLLRRPTT